MPRSPLLLMSAPRRSLFHLTSNPRNLKIFSKLPLATASPRSISHLGRSTRLIDALSSGRRSPRLRRVSAAAEDALPSESVIQKAQQTVSGSTPSEDISSTIISALLLIAFVVISILTSGVIYLGVTDFLQKRERDKFEKEEVANKKKSRRKTKIKARGGPRGFGQKLEEEDED